ncbi:hypothetical protein [Synechococcus sp. LA31]|uniref:hypothetical protein n=1 Tax=Synechococcus sp. LA31 TaxID=2741953 RepID=UPI001BDD5D04|nr:hypothetical protein [Synechococcus sp. LA31]QVV66529.1 hypothetical protein KJJ24_08315 [Synechococcus sp. LA31]
MSIDIAISQPTACTAMGALQRCIQRSSREESLDGRPSRRGASPSPRDADHLAHAEISQALGDDNSFALGAWADPKPEEVMRATELASYLLDFWCANNEHLVADGIVPAGPAIRIASAIDEMTWLCPTRARSVLATVAKSKGLRLLSCKDWGVVEAAANG